MEPLRPPQPFCHVIPAMTFADLVEMIQTLALSGMPSATKTALAPRIVSIPDSRAAAYPCADVASNSVRPKRPIIGGRLVSVYDGEPWLKSSTARASPRTPVPGAIANRETVCPRARAGPSLTDIWEDAHPPSNTARKSTKTQFPLC